MSDESWEVVDEVPGDIQAEILRGLLEAQGMRVWLNKEGAGHAMGIEIGMLGRVQILVPAHSAEEARFILGLYYSGELEQEGLESIPDDLVPPEDLPGDDYSEEEDQG